MRPPGIGAVHKGRRLHGYGDAGFGFLLDGSAANNDFSVVKDHSLSGSDCALRFIEENADLAVWKRLQNGGCLALAVSCFGGNGEGGSQFGDGDPVDPTGNQFPGKESAVGAENDGA